jgi:uncharacterized protein YifN (PemK superfamily)
MKKNPIKEIKKFLDESKDLGSYAPHVIVGVNSDDDGEPTSSIVMVAGDPYLVLGMIESLMGTLKILKKEFLEKVITYQKGEGQQTVIAKNKLDKAMEATEKLISKLPPGLREKMEDFKKRMEDATSTLDLKKLEALKKEFEEMNPLKQNEKDDEKDSSKDDFDINNFKG